MAEKIEQTVALAAEKIKNADAVLVSASNGLSIAEGYHIFANNAAFHRYFGDFEKKYGVRSIIEGVFAHLPAKAHADFMQMLKHYFVEDYAPSAPLQDLKKILAGKEYFIVTSNADTHFQLNGFDPDRVFEVEGNFIDLTAGTPEWEKQRDRFNAFLAKYRGKRVVVLELGIGARNALIKLPLMELVERETNYFFVTMNLPQEIFILPEIESRSLAIAGDLSETLAQLAAAR